MEKMYIVYAKLNDNSYIAAVNSSAFLEDVTGWVEIDRGSGNRYHYANASYFPEYIITDNGAYRYKLINGKAVECTPEEIAAQEAAMEPEQPESNGSVWDELDAAYQEGVDSV